MYDRCIRKGRIMRKKNYEKMLSMITTMRTAIKSLEDLYRKGQLTIAQTILGDLQDAAIALGNLIEQSEGEGTEAVKKLEDFCEQVWECYQDNTQNNTKYLIKLMNKTLIKVENILKFEIKYEYEIVFLPYKASMWDCFESIWMEARKDSRCRCRVIPIPYFERNPDGSLGQMHDESDLYPDYVPITEYSKYNLSEMNPDMIFIHNPYDQYNNVTTIHPDYYSSKIRQYTSLLVYIPYYLTSGDRGILTTSLMPGTVYPNTVITQSKEIRNVLIEKFKEERNLSKEQIKKAGLDKKYLALGSPKTDRLVSGDWHTMNIPKEWLEKACHNPAYPEQKSRKVIFYNIALDELLNSTEILMNKFKHLIEIFLQRNDMVLLWRPHPLCLNTLKTMRPQYYERYVAMVYDFKRLENGIYDETPDSQKALIFSDAYIGSDTSSISESFGIMGKPCLYMDYNDDTISQSSQIRVRTLSAGVQSGGIWMFHSKYNAVFRLDLATNTMKFIESISDVENKCNMFDAVVKYQNKLYFTPYACKYLVEVNTETNEISKILLQDKEIHSHFVSARYKDKLYLISVVNGCQSYIFDLKTHMAEKFDFQIPKEWEYPYDFPVFSDCTLCNSRLFLLCSVKPELLEYNLETHDITIHKYHKSVAFNKMSSDGDNIWIVSHRPEILFKWNRTTGFIVVFDKLLTGEDKLSIPAFSRMLYLDGYLWLIPSWNEQLIKIDVYSNWVIEIDLHGYGIRKDYREGPLFTRYDFDDRWLYLFSHTSNTLCKVDLRTNEIVCISMDENCLEGSETVKNAVLKHSENPIYRESYCSAEEFLDIVYQGEDEVYSDRRKRFFRAGIENVDGQTGKRIWWAMKEVLEGENNNEVD